MEVEASNLAVLGLVLAFLVFKAGGEILKDIGQHFRGRRVPARRRRAPSPRREPRFLPLKGRPRVVDGDTIRIGRDRVRLFGMDAPEMEQPGGDLSRAHLMRLIDGRVVVAQPVAIDVYGRFVARVWLGGTDLSARMVLDGFAVAMRDWHPDYVFHERAARRERRGLWADDPVNGIGCPSTFRQAQKSRPSERRTPPARPDLVVVKTARRHPFRRWCARIARKAFGTAGGPASR